MSSHKQEYGKTRLGLFISKATEFLPELAGAGLKLATGNVSGALEDVGGILNANAGKNEKTRLLLQEFKIKEMEFAKDFYELEVKEANNARDNETARDISEHSSWLSKNIHELIAITVIGAWLFAWYFTPAIPYKDITGVVTLILGYLYGRTRPQ